MSWWRLVISHVVIAGLALGAGYYLKGCGGVLYKWKTKTVVVEKVKWYKEKCGDTVIDGKQNKNEFNVFVENKCFRAERTLGVTLPPEKTILIIPSGSGAFGLRDGKFDVLVGGSLNVYKTWGMFGFGGGLNYQHSLIFKNDYYGGSISAVLKFN
jgi:hypothetical protein